MTTSTVLKLQGDRSDPVPLIGGLSEIASDLDLVLCDVWGVIHNGIVASAPAYDSLMRFRSAGGGVILITNAPRPCGSVIGQLDRLGVPRAAYDNVVTSGDLTRATIVERKGEILHHIGPERDLPIFEGLELRFGNADEADYVVCTGLFDDTRETVEDYRPTLERLFRRKLWMLCANPDLVVERGNELIPCAGSIAAAYEEIGGEVFYAGKPHRPIYDLALTMAEKLSGRAPKRSRVLAIGDAMRTDIAGAVGAGIRTVFVARGIHAGDLKLGEGELGSSHVQDWIAGQAVRPDWMIDRLAWA